MKTILLLLVIPIFLGVTNVSAQEESQTGVTNHPPVAVNDTLITYKNVSKTIDPRKNDSDVDGDSLVVTSVTQASYGSTSFSSTSITYMPNLNYVWPDMFQYTISDGKWWFATWQVNVSVIERDDKILVKNPHAVQTLQKEFIQKFKELKENHKNLNNVLDRRELLEKQKELREEYLVKLKSITGSAKEYPYEWEEAKENYKEMLHSTYWARISQMTDIQLERVIWRIDNLLVQINESNTYSAGTKQKLSTMLIALRELILENIRNPDFETLFESLFE